MIAKSSELNYISMKFEIDSLCTKNKDASTNEIVRIIKEIVPEYKSNNSMFEKLDKV